MDGRKLASVGIRVRRGASYHGIALNVSVGMEPFGRINPCGYVGLEMTRLADLSTVDSVSIAAEALAPHLLGSYSERRDREKRTGRLLAAGQCSSSGRCSASMKARPSGESGRSLSCNR